MTNSALLIANTITQRLLYRIDHFSRTARNARHRCQEGETVRLSARLLMKRESLVCARLQLASRAHFDCQAVVYRHDDHGKRRSCVVGQLW